MSEPAEKLPERVARAIEALERAQRDTRLGDRKHARLNLRAAQACIVEALVLLAKKESVS